MAYDDLKIEVYTHFLHPGMILKGDGYDEAGKKVIDRDVPISQAMIDRLMINGVKIITYTRERLKLKKSFTEDNSQISEQHINRAVNVLNDIEMSLLRNNVNIPVKEVESVIVDFMDDIRDNKDACLNLLDLVEYDDYTFTHSINVSTISLNLGISLNLEEEKLIALGKGALLHDIGKTMIPIEIINKPGKPTPEEWHVLKQHPIFGYNILKAETDFNNAILNGVLLHHENYGGKGYPFGVSSDKTNAYSQIISVADVFDAFTSKRSYKEARPFSDAFSYIMDNSGTKFHPKIAQIFLRDMVKKLNGEAIYPVSSYVLLNTGEIAYVVNHRLGEFSIRPIVNIFFNPHREQKFLKFPLQIDLERDHNRHVIRRILDSSYIRKFDEYLGRDEAVKS